jgi:hypothetical protein
MVTGYGNKFHAGNRVGLWKVDPITMQGFGRLFSGNCEAEMCVAWPSNYVQRFRLIPPQ